MLNKSITLLITLMVSLFIPTASLGASNENEINNAYSISFGAGVLMHNFFDNDDIRKEKNNGAQQMETEGEIMDAYGVDIYIDYYLNRKFAVGFNYQKYGVREVWLDNGFKEISNYNYLLTGTYFHNTSLMRVGFTGGVGPSGYYAKNTGTPIINDSSYTAEGWTVKTGPFVDLKRDRLILRIGFNVISGFYDKYDDKYEISGSGHQEYASIGYLY